MKTSGLFLLFMMICVPGFSSESSAHATMIQPGDQFQNTIKETKTSQNIFQKIRQVLYIKKLQKTFSRDITNKKRRQGRLSLFLGLASVALLFVPFGLWFALPAAIVGLIFGIKSVEGNSNVEGIIGIVASGLTLSIFLIVGIVLLSIGLSAF